MPLRIPALVALTLSLLSTIAGACPLCGPAKKSISDDFESSQAVVIGQLVSSTPLASADQPDRDAFQGTFRIEHQLKGTKEAKSLAAVCFGQPQRGDSFLLMGVGRDALMWTTPLRISPRACDYLLKLREVPPSGPERLAFFLDYLEDKDPLLAQDSYDEFVKAPYATIRTLADRLPRERLLEFIAKQQIAERRQLYFMLLGLCGRRQDLPFLESLLRSTPGKSNSGVDALIACYLSLSGGNGMTLIEDLFLRNPRATPPDTYAAVRAVQFHLLEAQTLPRERLLAGARQVLARPELADLVIPLLVQCQDWSCVDQLTELFRAADDKSNFVKLPIVNYLRVCPLPAAREKLRELEKIDSETVERAVALFPEPFKVDLATGLAP